MCVGKAGRELGERNSMCKGPEAGRVLGPQRNRKEAGVAGTQREGVRWVGARLEACPTESGGHNVTAASLDCQRSDGGWGQSGGHGEVMGGMEGWGHATSHSPVPQMLSQSFARLLAPLYFVAEEIRKPE